MFWNKPTARGIAEQLLLAEREWRESGPHAEPPEPTIYLNDEHSEMPPGDNARYLRLLAILRYPLDGESDPSPADMAALTEVDRDRMERCAILASWDRFWRRDQCVPGENHW